MVLLIFGLGPNICEYHKNTKLHHLPFFDDEKQTVHHISIFLFIVVFTNATTYFTLIVCTAPQHTLDTNFTF